MCVYDNNSGQLAATCLFKEIRLVVVPSNLLLSWYKVQLPNTIWVTVVSGHLLSVIRLRRITSQGDTVHCKSHAFFYVRLSDLGRRVL